jgi:cellulose synthase/poly-beta-1,6-N-acetylglucosamine synthase-like glycosyltransferase
MPADQLRELLTARLGDLWTDVATTAGAPAVDQPQRVESRFPLVSVVVPSTFERVSLLERCVASLVAQDYPAFEVVLVDNRPDGSAQRAGLWARLCSDSRVSVVAEPRPGISAARNRGVSAAAGEVVAFTDDDVEVGPGWLRAIGRRFAAEPRTDCVTGLVLPRELETPAQIWFERSGSKVDQVYVSASFANDRSRRGRFLGGLRRNRFNVTARRDGFPDETVSIYSGKLGMGANMAFRTTTLRSLGGFDEALGAGSRSHGGEDLCIISRLMFGGGRLVFQPSMFVYHTHRRTLDELERQMYGYGTGYTAMVAALVCGDVRHLVGLGAYAAHAVGLALRRSASRDAGEYPRELSKAEARGLLKGPWLYVAGRRSTRSRGRLQSPLSEVSASVG